MHACCRYPLLLCCLVIFGSPAIASAQAAATARKVRDIVIYHDPAFYSCFPSIVQRPDGELLVAFRRAPDWRPLGQTVNGHADATSQLMLVRSRDGGRSWSATPELIFAHPFGGSQDPCLQQMRDGTLLCTSYGWAQLRPEVAAKLRQPVRQSVRDHGTFTFMGGYILRSEDGGRSWQGPLIPPAAPTEQTRDIFGGLTPVLNRGAMCEGRDGRLFWVVQVSDRGENRSTSNHLMISTDRGLSWEYGCVVAADDEVVFNETSIYETPGGDLVAFMRTARFEDEACIARSTDGGKSFAPWQGMGFRGHPLQALRLPDQRVLLVYGYRHAPYGIRARILNAECTDFATAAEIVLRDDGGNWDIGYPWAAMVDARHVLVVYYFNQDDGTRHIAGTMVEIMTND
jgi:hypothetical protein